MLELNSTLGPTRVNEDLRSVLCRMVDMFVGLALLGGAMGGATGAQAQVQIEQVEPVTSQIEGATQGQVIVTVGEEIGDASRGDVLDLIPGETPLLPDLNGGGSSVVVYQRGHDNETNVTQSGSGNEASVTQTGFAPEDGGEIEGAGGASGGSNNIATVDQSGWSNLAVLVHLGSQNRTTLTQNGDDNVAGVRLRGFDNRTTVNQAGNENEYLLDFTGSGLRSPDGPHRVQQIGSRNTLIQTGSGSMPFNVRQRGNGMRMSIRHTAP